MSNAGFARLAKRLLALAGAMGFTVAGQAMAQDAGAPLMHWEEHAEFFERAVSFPNPSQPFKPIYTAGEIEPNAMALDNARNYLDRDIAGRDKFTYDPLLISMSVRPRRSGEWSPGTYLSGTPRVYGVGQGRALAVGDNHVCMTVKLVIPPVNTTYQLRGGGVKCWGDNDSGQLGNGARTRSDAPVAVANLPIAIDAVVVGGRHSCALTGNDLRDTINGVQQQESGQVWCWGANDFGQLGLGDTQARLTPVKLAGLGPVHALTAGADHTCAIEVSGRILCWGRNDSGQAGGGATPNRTSPTEVAGLPYGTVSIAAGGRHTCIAVIDGAPWCWGANDRLQLGAGALAPEAAGKPVQVAWPASAGGFPLFVTAGADHACAHFNATATGGKTACWGRDTVSARRGAGAPAIGVTVMEGDSHGVAADAAWTCALASSTDTPPAEANGLMPPPQLRSKLACTFDPADLSASAAAVALTNGLTDNDVAVVDAGAQTLCWLRKSGEVRCAGTRNLGVAGLYSSGGNAVSGAPAGRVRAQLAFVVRPNPAFAFADFPSLDESAVGKWTPRGEFDFDYFSHVGNAEQDGSRFYVEHTVAQATTTRLTATPTGPTTVNMSAAVAGFYTTPGPTRPDGAVSFRDGDREIGVGALTAQGASATFAASIDLGCGQHSITAAFSSEYFDDSVSEPVVLGLGYPVSISILSPQVHQHDRNTEVAVLVGSADASVRERIRNQWVALSYVDPKTGQSRQIGNAQLLSFVAERNAYKADFSPTDLPAGQITLVAALWPGCLIADPATKGVEVWRAAQNITADIQGAEFAEIGGSSTISASGGGSGQAVVVSVDPASASVCRIDGAKLLYLTPGDCAVSFHQPEDANHTAANHAVTVVVTKKRQTLSFVENVEELARNLASTRITATGGGSGNPVTVEVGPGSTGCNDIWQISFTGGGPCTLIARQAGNDQYLPGELVKTFPVKGFQAFGVWPQPTPEESVAGGVLAPHYTTGVDLNTPVTVAVDASSVGVCAPDGASLRLLKAGVCTFTASRAGNAFYRDESQTLSFTVYATPVVTFATAAPADARVGGAYDAVAKVTNPMPWTPFDIRAADESAAICVTVFPAYSNGTGRIRLLKPGACVVIARYGPVETRQTFEVKAAN